MYLISKLVFLFVLIFKKYYNVHISNTVPEITQSYITGSTAVQGKSCNLYSVETLVKDDLNFTDVVSTQGNCLSHHEHPKSLVTQLIFYRLFRSW